MLILTCYRFAIGGIAKGAIDPDYTEETLCIRLVIYYGVDGFGQLLVLYLISTLWIFFVLSIYLSATTHSVVLSAAAACAQPSRWSGALTEPSVIWFVFFRFCFSWFFCLALICNGVLSMLPPVETHGLTGSHILDEALCFRFQPSQFSFGEGSLHGVKCEYAQ